VVRWSPNIWAAGHYHDDLPLFEESSQVVFIPLVAIP